MYPLGPFEHFVRNVWYIAARADEVGRELTVRRILNQPVILYRTATGTPVALHGVCPHRSFPLSQGRLADDNVVCGYHGFVFNPSGKCVKIPSQQSVPAACQVQSYPIVERWHWVWIWMGDAGAADPASIPDLTAYGFGVEGWTSFAGADFVLDARYMLLIDNLMDLTHIGFVHFATLNTDELVRYPIRVIDEEPIIKIQRSTPAEPLNPLSRALLGEEHPSLDNESSSDFLSVSAIVTGPTYFVPAQFGRETKRLGGIRFFHGITPETPTRTRYYSGMSRDMQVDNGPLQRFLTTVDGHVRGQDKEALERVEQMLPRDGSGPKQEVSAAADAGALRVRRRIQEALTKA